MTDFATLVKRRILELGRADATTYTAEILGVSVATASLKLRGKVKFTEADMVALNKALNLDAEDLKTVLGG